MRGVIRLNDPTSHGGRVTSASGSHTVHDVGVARLGDRCCCPLKGHGGCVIAEGDPAVLIDGRPVAFEGHKTSCGATLISTAPGSARMSASQRPQRWTSSDEAESHDRLGPVQGRNGVPVGNRDAGGAHGAFDMAALVGQRGNRRPVAIGVMGSYREGGTTAAINLRDPAEASIVFVTPPSPEKF